MAAFLRSEIPGERKCNLEFGHIEGINIEVNLNEENGFFLVHTSPHPYPMECLEMTVV